jgi:NifU-like protein involved in Fe-S cluster formation
MSDTTPIKTSDLEKSDVVNKTTGQKWVYSPIVKEHFFHPKNILLEEPAEGQFDARGTVGSPACLIPTTQIVTKKGVKFIKDVEVREELLGHDGLYHEVDRIFHPQNEKKIVAIGTQFGDLTCTADHLIFGIAVPRGEKYPFVHTKQKMRLPRAWFHASELQKGDIVLYPIDKTVHNIVWLDIPKLQKKKFDHLSKTLPDRVPLNAEVLELFGYFVAEGHTKKDLSEIGLTFCDDETEYAERAAKFLNKYFGVTVSTTVIPAHHRINLAVSSTHLAQTFGEWFGFGAAQKNVPEVVMFLPIEKQVSFIKGLWRGDGYFSNERAQKRAGFATISEQLTHQLRRLLLRQGIISSLYREEAKTIKGVKHQASNRLHVGDLESLKRLAKILEITFTPDPKKKRVKEVWEDGDFAYIPVRSVTPTTFAGRLYNFEVKDSHTYCTDSFLVHNCGDVMDIWIKVDPTTERVVDLKWKTFGCGSAIAATSMFSVMVTENGGLTIEDAMKIKPQDIMERLGGLPNRKIHCSVLADKAFRKAVNNYFHAVGKHDRVEVEGARVVDKNLNITDKDIEEAVLEGAQTLDEVQKKLKVGVGDPEAIPEIEQLIRFYSEKYYG